MKAIEKEMINAIHSICGHSRHTWSNANTRVTRKEYDQVNVYLHNNLIAEIDHDMAGKVRQIRLSSADWKTVTTKSRLNAIASHFGVYGIYQKQGYWFFGNGDSFCEFLTQEVAA